MGERFAPLVDTDHFLGRSALDIPWKKKNPRVNIRQDGKIFEMEVAVPGFQKEELEIAVKKDVLSIRAEKRASEKENDSEFILEEFNFDSFERKFKLAKSISREKINAEYEKGILRLTFIEVPAEEEKELQEVEVL